MANEELAFRANNGDEHARDVLYEQVERLILKITSKYYPFLSGAGIEPDDLKQEAYLAFLHATETYQQGKGLFSSWLIFHVKGSCRRALKLDTKVFQKVSLDTPLAQDEEGRTLIEFLADARTMSCEETAELTDLQRIVRGAVAQLTECDRRFIHDIYWDERSIREAGERAGDTTVGRAASRHQRILRRLGRDHEIRSLSRYYVNHHHRYGARLTQAETLCLSWIAESKMNA